MTGYTICALVLLVALLAALSVVARGDGVERLVGLELISGVGTMFLLVMAEVSAQSYYLSVPIVFVPMTFAGTLVFTRLLGRRKDSR
jgi:multisubunit Na+/H+ antiporter MnhF subunit